VVKARWQHGCAWWGPRSGSLAEKQERKNTKDTKDTKDTKKMMCGRAIESFVAFVLNGQRSTTIRRFVGRKQPESCCLPASISVR
jgi:hypothetical protein